MRVRACAGGVAFLLFQFYCFVCLARSPLLCFYLLLCCCCCCRQYHHGHQDLLGKRYWKPKGRCLSVSLFVHFEFYTFITQKFCFSLKKNFCTNKFQFYRKSPDAKKALMAFC